MTMFEFLIFLLLLIASIILSEKYDLNFFLHFYLWGWVGVCTRAPTEDVISPGARVSGDSRELSSVNVGN